MDQGQIIARYEARARAVNTSMTTVCVQAGIMPSTFFRWKPSRRNPHPTSATLASLNKLDAELSRLERQASRKAVSA